jgi:sorting and assembly machinery component 37
LIESRAPTLLDISLYVGFENFRLSTRPAYTKILPWYANYTLPSRRRAAARARTEHLGISSIDVDHVHEESGRGSSGLDVNMGKEQTFEAETKKRASLLLPRKETLRSLLQRPEHAAIFKLNALADAFFEPLRDMLGEHSFLGGAEEPTAVDCLAYGYLSLMLFPDVSQDWLAATMRNKYQSLVEYTERLHIRLSLATHVDQVVDLLYCGERGPKRVPDHASPLSLPWKAPTTTPVTTAVRGALGDLWDLLPVLGQRNKLQLWHSEQHPFLSRNLPALLAFTTASIAAATYLALHNGFLIWPHGHEMHIFGRKRLSDLGHAGAALAGVAFLGPYAGQG